MNRIWKSIMMVTLLFLMACTTEQAKEEKPEAKPEEKPIPARQSTSMESLTKLYLPGHVSEKRETPITHAVIHFSSNAQEKPDDPYRILDTYDIFSTYGVSSHYVIDRTGKLYQFVTENRIAYHAGKGSLANYPTYENKLNAYSIGIEIHAIGTKEEMSSMLTEEDYDNIDPIHIGYTAEQYETLKDLLINISAFYGTMPLDREHIIGHDEYAPERKTDPGSLFDWEHLMNLLDE
jgi:N-acetyl-anhydromuramyl-L-alanine amidase AmpD